MNSSKENIVFWSMLALFVIINVATAHWSPRVWVDEASYSDPSVNLVLGKGFKSTAWASQDKNEFWASNAPLHQYVLVPWLYVFGVSATAARSLNILFMVVTSLLLWRLFSVSKIITDWHLKILCIACLWLSELMSDIYRQGRPDCITLLLAAATALIFYSDWKSKKYLVVVVGALGVVAGIQLPPFIFIVLGMAFIFSKERKNVFVFGFLYGIGIVAGLVGLLAFLYTQGSAYAFLSQTFASGYTVSGDIAQAIVYSDARTYDRIAGRINDLTRIASLYFRDPSSLILIISLAALATWQLITTRKSASGWKFLLCFLLVPPALQILGRYPYYYTWMALIVLLIGCFVCYQQLEGKWKIILPAVMSGLILVTGLPRTLLIKGLPEANRQEEIREFVDKHVSPADWVYGEHEIYYACKPKASEFFTLSYSGGRGLPAFPDAQREKLSKLILYPNHLEESIQKVGGQWKPLAAMSNSLTVYVRE